MLKLLLSTIFVTLSFGTDAASSSNSLQFLPYNPQWGASFGSLANLAQVQGESDGLGLLLPGALQEGQFVAFPGESDFPQVYGPGTNPVMQLDELDWPVQMVNGRLTPVPKPNHDGLFDLSPQFASSPGYPNMFNPVVNTAGLVPAAPSMDGAASQLPLFLADELGDLYKFQGYASGDLEDILKAQALANLLNPPAASTASTTTDSSSTASTTDSTSTTGTDSSSTASDSTASTAADSTASTDSSASTGTATASTGTAASTDSANTAAQNFNQLMWMMGGQNPLNDEDVNRLPAVQDYLKTLPGGNLISMYGKVQDSVYGESDAFIPGPNGQPIFNIDNVDRRLQKTAPESAQTSKKASPLEDPFFWAFLITLVILTSGITVFALNRKRTSSLEDVLMDSDYSSHTQTV